MATNPTTDKVKTGDSDTKTEAKPFSFSRLFNRNGHAKAAVAPPTERTAEDVDGASISSRQWSR